MKKKGHASIPDFSSKKKTADGKVVTSNEKGHIPNPRQPQKPPAQAKNGGRRGT
ncbi:MAG: hypothetical protein M3Y64_11565 [Gemmatimonadota bacterium]|nr:hypothetical protein [Gemmatimonadota bacterium]